MAWLVSDLQNEFLATSNPHDSLLLFINAPPMISKCTLSLGP